MFEQLVAFLLREDCPFKVTQKVPWEACLKHAPNNGLIKMY